MILATSTQRAFGFVILAVVAIGFVVWFFANLRAGRDEVGSEIELAPNRSPQLTDDELEGVMAHEMGHVKNYDIRVSMIVFGLVVAVGFIADMFLRIAFFGGNLIVNTGAVIQGPPIGTNTTGQEAEGPHCIGAASGGH